MCQLFSQFQKYLKKSEVVQWTSKLSYFVDANKENMNSNEFLKVHSETVF